MGQEVGRDGYGSQLVGKALGALVGHGELSGFGVEKGGIITVLQGSLKRLAHFVSGCLGALCYHSFVFQRQTKEKT